MHWPSPEVVLVHERDDLPGLTAMRRRLPLAAVALVALVTACSGDDDDTTATTVTATAASPATTATRPAATTTAPVSTVPPLTTPVSVIEDTAALGASTLSTVDLTTGAAGVPRTVGGEVGVLGIAVDDTGLVTAVTDAPALLQLDPADLAAPAAEMPVDAGGSTLLALARRTDGALFAIADTGAVVQLDPRTGTTVTVAEIALDDPGVGLDVTADGRLDVVVATGARLLVDVGSGEVLDLPALTGDEAPPRIVALAHDARQRYGVDADTDELVTIADDGTVTTIGPLALDVTEGASLDVAPDGTALLANPG